MHLDLDTTFGRVMLFVMLFFLNLGAGYLISGISNLFGAWSPDSFLWVLGMNLFITLGMYPMMLLINKAVQQDKKRIKKAN